MYSRKAVVLSMVMMGSLAHAATITLSTDASLPARNDLFQATVAIDVRGETPGEVASQANAAINKALLSAKKKPSIKASTGNVSTTPIFDNKTRRINGWSMHSELRLETPDAELLSGLLASLQADLVITSISASPSMETRQRVENDATVAAIASFRARADLIAGTLGKTYKIKRMDIGHQYGFTPVSMMKSPRAEMSMASVPAMPVEGGESRVSVSINGEIEIAD